MVSPQNEKYLELFARLQDLKAEAAAAKQRGDTTGNKQLSRHIRAMLIGKATSIKYVRIIFSGFLNSPLPSPLVRNVLWRFMTF